MILPRPFNALCQHDYKKKASRRTLVVDFNIADNAIDGETKLISWQMLLEIKQSLFFELPDRQMRS